jgi:hypothetical protein
MSQRIVGAAAVLAIAAFVASPRADAQSSSAPADPVRFLDITYTRGAVQTWRAEPGSFKLTVTIGGRASLVTYPTSGTPDPLNPGMGVPERFDYVAEADKKELAVLLDSAFKPNEPTPLTLDPESCPPANSPRSETPLRVDVRWRDLFHGKGRDATVAGHVGVFGDDAKRKRFEPLLAWLDRIAANLAKSTKYAVTITGEIGPDTKGGVLVKTPDGDYSVDLMTSMSGTVEALRHFRGRTVTLRGNADEAVREFHDGRSVPTFQASGFLARVPYAWDPLDAKETLLSPIPLLGAAWIGGVKHFPDRVLARLENVEGLQPDTTSGYVPAAVFFEKPAKGSQWARPTRGLADSVPR